MVYCGAYNNKGRADEEFKVTQKQYLKRTSMLAPFWRQVDGGVCRKIRKELCLPDLTCMQNIP